MALVLELETSLNIGAWGLGFPSGFAAELTGVKVVLRYDEVTPQAQRLADDCDRHSGHSVRLLFCATAGLRRDGARRHRSDLWPQADSTRN